MLWSYMANGKIFTDFTIVASALLSFSIGLTLPVTPA